MTSPSRPGSDIALAAALVAALLAAAPAAAQELSTGTPVFEVPSPILTVDQDRLFAESDFGKRVAAEIEERSRTLAAENRTIESDLKAEEQALTDARPTLPADQFRSRADAFDAKVQRIRAEQDAKAQALTEFRETEQRRFAAELGDVLADIARARGALAVMDRRAMLISADSIDITAAAVAAMNARLGAGTTPGPDPAPAPQPGTPPEAPATPPGTAPDAPAPPPGTAPDPGAAPAPQP